MEYVVLLYKYDVVEVGDLFVILHIYNKFLSYKKKFYTISIFSEKGEIICCHVMLQRSGIDL